MKPNAKQVRECMERALGTSRQCPSCGGTINVAWWPVEAKVKAAAAHADSCIWLLEDVLDNMGRL